MIVFDNDFTLLSSSPCINTGTDDWYGNGSIDITDYDGPAPDMGSFEFICDIDYDDCGVCGGDSTTCLDCEGVPNGDSEEDCLGVCGGSGIYDNLGECCAAIDIDLCGICGGDNSDCMDCAGIPNGDSVTDECGVCGGNNCCWDRPSELIGQYEFSSSSLYNFSADSSPHSTREIAPSSFSIIVIRENSLNVTST